MSGRKPKEKKEIIYCQFFCEHLKRRTLWIYAFGPFVKSQYDCLVYDPHDPDKIVSRAMFAWHLSEPVAESTVPAPLRSAVNRHYQNAFDRGVRN